MADEKKDQQKTTSEGNQILDADEFSAMVRGERAGDLQEKKDDDREPEVTREGERDVRADRREASKDKEEEVDPNSPLGKALSTIETMKRSQRDLEERLSRRDTEKREPEIELEELVPGVRVPKDRGKWPVSLPKELLEKVGIDPGLQPGLHTLANLLYWDLSNAFSKMLESGVDERLNRRQSSVDSEKAFLEKYDDLADHKDLAEFTEANIRKDGRHARSNFRDADEYQQFVATETRRVIARARGISYDDYMKEYERKRGETKGRDAGRRTERQSRVISSGTGRRSPGSGESSFEKESRELM